MKVAFASIAFAFAFVFALFVGASLAQEIVAASYTDGTCTTTRTNPQTLQSGQCVYSSDFNFWYTIKADPNNTATYFYGCAQGCAESTCAQKGSSPFGSCPSISMGNGQIVYVSAFRVETQDSIDLQVFSDSQCGEQITDYGTLVLGSGQCQYVKSIKQYLMVSHINPNDAPPARQLAYRALCNSDCSSCRQYGRAELNKCTPFANVWFKANLDTSSSSSDVTLKVWVLAVIIVGSAVGGALCAFFVSGCLCCIWSVTRRHHHHDYTRINHH